MVVPIDKEKCLENLAARHGLKGTDKTVLKSIKTTEDALDVLKKMQKVALTTVWQDWPQCDRQGLLVSVTITALPSHGGGYCFCKRLLLLLVLSPQHCRRQLH